jgi:hypothetical protein
MLKCSLLWFLAFAAVPLIASPQINPLAENTVACVPQAYIANLLPIFQPFAALPESAYEKFDDTGATNVSVTVLVTIGPEGRVTGTESLGGPEFLRKTSIDTVRHYKYQPVIRNGQPVCALTSANVVFQTPGKLLASQDSTSERAAWERLQEIQKQWLRTPKQVLADMQQEVDVPGGLRRTLALPRLAKAALAAGELEKAVAYAQEGLGPSGSGGQSTFDCNMVLGQVALRNGNVAEAARYLIASGKSSGSPALSSFGPNMSLAKELLERGQGDVVLQFFDLCRALWTDHAHLLDRWSETVRKGGVPNFGANLQY